MHEEDNQQCEKDLKTINSKISFYDKNIIKEDVSNFARDKEIILANLKTNLKVESIKVKRDDLNFETITLFNW